jgi:hypothetical protein
MLDLRRPSHVMCTLGAVAVLASAFLPWINGTTLDHPFSLSPVATPYVRGGLVIVVAGLLAGAALFAFTGSPALLGLAGTIWFNAALLVWLIGWRLGQFVPLDIIPDRAGIVFGPGVAVGFLGSFLVVAGAALVLTEETWSASVERPDVWRVVLALGLVAAAAALRTVPWFNLDAGSLRWSAGVETIPFVGDFVAFVLLAVTILLVVGLVCVRRWMAVALSVAAFVVGGLALLTVVVQAFLDEGARLVSDRLGVSVPAHADVSWGPWLALGFAGVLLTYAVAVLRQPAVRPAESTVAPLADPLLPF